MLISTAENNDDPRIVCKILSTLETLVGKYEMNEKVYKLIKDILMNEITIKRDDEEYDEIIDETVALVVSMAKFYK